MEPRREDVRQHRQIEDLLHRLLLVGELQEVPVGVRHRHVLGLAADPAAHVDVAIGRAGTVGVHVQANARVAGLAHAATAARDVEGHRAEIALLDELDARAALDHLARDLVSEDQPLGRSGPTPHHVLVGAADVRRNDLEDRPVRQLATDIRGVDPGPVLELEAGEVDVVDLDLAGPHVRDSSVVSHESLPPSSSLRARSGRSRVPRSLPPCPGPARAPRRGADARSRRS